jgi:hypothetical protein
VIIESYEAEKRIQQLEALLEASDPREKAQPHTSPFISMTELRSRRRLIRPV